MPDAVKLSRSWRYRRFLENLRIRADSGLIVPLKFTESQEHLWSYCAPLLDNHSRMRFIVLKGRQVCASTFFQALIFARTIERPGTQSLVLAQDLDTSHYLFSMAKRYLDYLPMPKIIPPKMREIILPFPQGPSVFSVVSAGVTAKGRGTNRTCVHGSETAFWPHPEIWTGLAQTIPDLADTICVLESTANGKIGIGEFFYNQWKLAISGDSEYAPVFIPWYAMKKYSGSFLGLQPVDEQDWDEEEKILAGSFGITGDQLAWRRWAIPNKCDGSLEKFHQEYPTTPEEAFISTGLPAFDRLALLKQRQYICTPMARLRATVVGRRIKLEPDLTGEVRVWKMPEKGHQYAIGADTAEGISGGDYACAEILDMGTMEQVACIHGTIPPWEFSVLLSELGMLYNKAVINVEVNNTGHAVQDHMIRTHEYPNLHLWRGRPDRPLRFKKQRLYGWETNVYSRPLLIESGRRAINSNLVTLHEEKLLDELHDFSRSDKGKYEASSGYDDRVIALLLALRTREENYYPVKDLPKPSEEMHELPVGVRVIDEETYGTAAMRKRLGERLRKEAKKATKTWLEM